MSYVKSVLIINDDPRLLNELLDIFLKEGFYRAIGTAAGDDVRTIIKQKNPDVVLLDIHIKGEDPIRLLRQIKAENKFLPVVMLTDEKGKPLARKALAAGASSYVVNSGLPLDIVKTVKSELGKSVNTGVEEKVNILIVDDDELNADMVNNFLNSEGYNSSVSYNPVKALELIKNNRPAIIFLDIVMPGMDGIELLSRIKDIDRKIKVIMMSGISDKDICKETILKGASGYITKPFSLQQLRASVIAALLAD